VLAADHLCRLSRAGLFPPKRMSLNPVATFLPASSLVLAIAITWPQGRSIQGCLTGPLRSPAPARSAAEEISKNACWRTIPHAGEGLAEYERAVASARWRTASARPSPMVAGVGVDRALNGIYNCHT